MQPPVTILNRREHHPDQRTVVVFGLYRGGTSMLAGLARLLGIFMGERIAPENNEDQDLLQAQGERLRELIRLRNASHDVWGWKDPGLFHSIGEWYPILRNPYFVVSFRGLLASVQTQVAGGFMAGVVPALRETHEHMGKIVEFVATAEAAGLPLMLVSYERALGRGPEVLEEMGRFVGLEATDAARSEARRFVDPSRGYGAPDLAALEPASRGGWGETLRRRWRGRLRGPSRAGDPAAWSTSDRGRRLP